ncbi:MAG: aminotransferase class I/II-fold pyridoxal phosphate-dependent enzyme [Chloroflexi bacterium]|nr:aminotransferase class I/II-fold pyridoxal phosphate-dependent enzyme [Chloroflexota bacterium]
MKPARRLLDIPSYPFARLSALVAQAQGRGIDVIRLDIGNPDLPPAPAVLDTLCRSVGNASHHGYSHHRGLRELRQAIADYYQRRFGVTLDPETQVIPLLGSKEGIVHMAQAVLDPGDVALVPDPGYAPYAMGAALAGAESYPLPLLPERGFLPDLNAVPEDIASGARLLWLNYPNNPTGATADLDFFADALDFARRHDILLCHDAPYCDVTYNGYIAPSILQIPGAIDTAIEFNSLSKTYNMAGWRVGMAVGNTEAVSALGQVKSNVDSGIFRPVQDAAITALSTNFNWIVARNQVYEERLRCVFATLQSLGMATTPPQATLYAWARVPAGWETAESFARDLLDHTGVVVAPGSFFGPAGEGYVRLSVTAPTRQLQEAMKRLQSFVHEHDTVPYR